MNCLKEKKETKRKWFLQVIFLIKSNYLICVFASKPTNFIRTFALLATACMTVHPLINETGQPIPNAFSVLD